MMVATGLPITPPAAAPTAQPATDASADKAAPEGGFLGTLMQLLTPQDPAEVAATGGAGVVSQLLDDAAGDVPDDVPLPDGAAALVAPILFPAVQPADIRAAQQLARQPGDSGDALAALTDAAAGALGGSVDTETTLLDRLGGGSGMALQGPAADASAVGLQGALSQPSATDASAAARTVPADTPASRQIHTPVGAPGWSDELGAQLHLMADKGHSVASLRLSPEHLGPLEVQISVQDSQASVWFGSTNSDTRAALEQALPRLREMFAAQGMSLSQSGVFNQSPREPGRQAAGTVTHGTGAEGIASTDPGMQLASRRGLVDAYA
ncbi:MAG: flagellar hook-length control protein FliK [Steroidobacteraceae bacterium]